MSALTLSHAARRTHAGTRRFPLRGVSNVLTMLVQAWRTRQAIRQLRDMDDTMLRDIGMDRGAIEHAVVHGRGRKPN